MKYLLSVGLSFSEASRGLKKLVEADFFYADRRSKKRWMFCWDEKERSLVLEEFDREKAHRVADLCEIALLDKG
ncbi:MAG: hypothetical protein Tsb0014_13520 [Pleurocapsa sp.]